MSIVKFFTKTFSIKRMLWVGDSYSTLATTTTFKGHIQQTEETMTESLGMRFTETWTIWCPSDTAIQRDDRLTEGSNEYVVRFIQEYNLPTSTGGNTHLEVFVEKYTSDYE